MTKRKGQGDKAQNRSERFQVGEGLDSTAGLRMEEGDWTLRGVEASAS